MPVMSFTDLRNYHVSRDPHGVVTVALDVPGRPHNVFGEEVVFELQTLVSELEHDGSARLVLFRSGKPSGFLAGGDLREIRAIRDPQTADQIIAIGQKLFDRLERLPMPTVAVIHGPCLGGGLEFALACQYRLACDDEHTRLGLPEVELGLLPGWGGTVRLPQRVGLIASLPILLSGRKLSARQAVGLGLVDRVFLPDQFDNGVEQFVADRLAGIPFPRPQPSWLARLRDHTKLGQRFVLRAARRQFARRGAHYPALPAILDAVEQGLFHGREQGLTRARELFEQLLFGPACRNLMRLFFERELARKRGTWVLDESSTPRPIRRIAVVGAGVMGAGIAQLAAFHGLKVMLKDVDEQILARALRRIEGLMDQAQRNGLLSPTEAAVRLQAITPCTDWDALADVDLAIEAVPEKEDLKREVFHELDRRLSPQAVLVSNTSALSIRHLAAASEKPGRVAGLHFFNPVHKMPLVELVRSESTSDATVATLVELVRSWGKVPLVVADQPGFLVNRVLFPYLDEAVRLVWEGLSPEEVDRSARDFGMPMGPLELLDQVGLDVAADVAHALAGSGTEPSPTQRCLAEMAARGWTGAKSGRGFYLHRHGRRGKAARWDSQMAGAAAVPSGRMTDPSHARRCQKRLVYAVLNEAARCLERRVVGEPWMVDLGMVLGTGFAPFLGGPLRLVDTWGLPHVVADLAVLERDCGPRFAPCKLLNVMREEGRRFYPAGEEEVESEAAEQPLRQLETVEP